MGSFLHNAAPCCPPCPGTRVLVQLSPQFRGRVSGLCGDFDGDASNDLRSRQGVLEPTAELAAHSWHLSPFCPEPGDLLHPCTVSMGRQGEGRGGQLQETCWGWGRIRRLGAVDGVWWPTVRCPQVNAHRASWARTRCGVMLQSLFARCHGEVPPQQHYEWCVHDACG